MMLSRFIGVSDIASVRFSLPSQLLEPIPNLGRYLMIQRIEVDEIEYWHYLDRPEIFIRYEVHTPGFCSLPVASEIRKMSWGEC